MEMTFPHHELRQDSVTHRTDGKKLLATVIARQANSRTVYALRQAEKNPASTDDVTAQLIHYFAHNSGRKTAVGGAFWRNVEPEQNNEVSVYQAGLAYVKNHALNHKVTGDQLNLVGHGASRKI